MYQYRLGNKLREVVLNAKRQRLAWTRIHAAWQVDAFIFSDKSKIVLFDQRGR